jgi:VWFA-related protein
MAILGIVATGAAATQSQPPAAPASPQTTFTTRVDVVQFDVTVLDEDHRPIRGLTASDFTVLENGKPQPIVAVVPIELPGPMHYSAPWMGEIDSDVVTNERDIRRLVILLMDDANTGSEHGESTSARKIAHRILDSLGPADLAGVVFTFNGQAQNLTSDRTRLRAAVESYNPKLSPMSGVPLGCELKLAGCVASALTQIGDMLRNAPPGRKIVMMISSSGGLNVMTDPFAQLSPVQEMFRALQQSSVTVYGFDPAGLNAPRSIGGRDLFTSPSILKAPNARTEEDRVRQARDDLMALADATGGRTVAGTNTPEVEVPGVFEENSLYYLVGFRSADRATDGRFRRVQVKVNRPEAFVHTRIGYFPEPEASKARRNRGRTPLDSALATDLPAREIPLRLSAAAFAVPGRKEAAVTIVSAIPLPDAAQTKAIEIATAAFNKEYAIRGVYRQTLASSPGGAVVETFARLPLKPGRYEIRLAAEAAGKSGGAKTFIDVPDFGKEPLSLSGLVIERAPSGAVANRALIADLIPVVPTTVREFSRSDRAIAFVRVYQRTGAPAEAVTLSWRITGEDNRTAVESTTDLITGQFSRSHSADGRFTIPLTELRAGEYLLTVEAVRGDRRSRRDVRFTLR